MNVMFAVVESLTEVIVIKALAVSIDITMRLMGDRQRVWEGEVLSVSLIVSAMRSHSNWLVNNTILLVVVVVKEVSHNLIVINIHIVLVHIIFIEVKLVLFPLLVGRDHLDLHGLLAGLGVGDEELLEGDRVGRRSRRQDRWLLRWTLRILLLGRRRRLWLLALRWFIFLFLLLLLLLLIALLQHLAHQIDGLISLVRLALLLLL